MPLSIKKRLATRARQRGKTQVTARQVLRAISLLNRFPLLLGGRADRTGVAHQLGVPVELIKYHTKRLRKAGKLVRLESGIYRPADKSRSGPAASGPHRRT